MEVNLDLYSKEKTIENDKKYIRILGTLQYFTLTCPDIAFFTNKSLADYEKSIEISIRNFLVWTAYFINRPKH